MEYGSLGRTVIEDERAQSADRSRTARETGRPANSAEYLPQRRGLRLAATALLFFVFGLPIAWTLVSVLDQAFLQERIGIVAIENRNDAPVIVWGTTQPVGRPTGDDPQPTHGFIVGPNASLRLPDDHVWESVAIYTLDCVLIAEGFADGLRRAVVAGTILSFEPSGSIGNLDVAQRTDECRLVPYEGLTPMPL